MSTIAYILLSGLLGVAGQLIMKQAMISSKPVLLQPENLLAAGLTLILNPTIVLGLMVYASGTLFWLVVLSRVDLSYAYPFASLNYIFILVTSWLFLGEQPSPMRIVGVVSICIGVWAISRTPAKTISASRHSRTRSTQISEGTH